MPRQIIGPSAPPRTPHRLRTAIGRLAGALTLKLHALAVRLDLAPPEFGREAPVDERDPAAVRAEWLRLVREWADYSPEEVFALKVGGAILALALGGLWVAVAALN